METKPMFLVMESIAPPVVDYARQGRVTEMLDKSPFNVFNLVSIIVIALAAFFLYKRFMDITLQCFQPGFDHCDCARRILPVQALYG